MIGIIGFLTDQFLQASARVLFPWEYPGHSSWLRTLVQLPFRWKARRQQAATAPGLPPIESEAAVG